MSRDVPITWPGSRLRPDFLLFVCSLACLGCGASEESARKETPHALANTSYGFIAVEPIVEDGSKKGMSIAPNLVEKMDEIRGALPLLGEAKVSLAMTIQARKVADPAMLDEVFQLVEAAAGHGLEVRPVPVLSADDGYFPNATNVAAYAAVVRQLIAQWSARGLDAGTLVVDMEPPRELSAALASLDLAKAVPRDHIDRARYADAVVAYAALVDELHAAGWKVGVTTQATLLADYDDDDDDMRQYFNVVLDGVAWDQVDFQAYRSVYAKQSPMLDAYFVYDLAKKANARFVGKQVGIGLGLTHPGPVFPDTATEDSQALRADLEAAVAAGVPRASITIYNLKGILLGPPVCKKVLPCAAADYVYEANDPRRWFLDVAGAAPPSKSVATSVLWDQFKLMDKLLDASEGSQAQSE